MLDQNTDRMWYVIGAVIVGAAIIFLMNSAFPTLFANVGTTFEEKVGDTSELMEDIHPRPTDGTQTDGVGPMKPDNVVKTGFQMKNTSMWQTEEYEWLSDNALVFRNGPENYQGGVIIPAAYFTEGNTYTITFDMTKLSGEVQGLGGHIHISSVVDVYIDGKYSELWEKGYNTEGYNRFSSTVVYPNDTEKHSVEVTFTKQASEQKKDENVYIQPNRAGNGSANSYYGNALSYEVLIENLEVYEHTK